MRRSPLLRLAALGALISVVGGSGLFAALTDTARTGTNSLGSGELAGSADIQIGLAVLDPLTNTFQCQSFSEDLTTPFFSFSSGVNAGFSSVARFCIQNVGSQSVTISALADELVDVDDACTGDEELLGDATCGESQAGELSSVISATFQDCGNTGIAVGGTLSDMVTTPLPLPLASLSPGTTRCYFTSVDYSATTSASMQQVAQSDSTTWRYRFDAAVAS